MFGLKKIAFLITFLFIAYSLNGIPLEANGGAPPPNPTIYTGSITVGGQVPSDSTVVLEGVRRKCIERCVTAKLGTFTSDAGIVENGIYVVTFGPPDATMVNSQITFHYEGLVKADLEDTFILRPTIRTESNWNLNFPAMPAITPTPAAPIVTDPVTTVETPDSELLSPIIPEMPTSVDLASAQALTVSGEMTVALGSVWKDYVPPRETVEPLIIFAKVGSYISKPAPLTFFTHEGRNTSDGKYVYLFSSLDINPGNEKYIGTPVEFYVRNVRGDSVRATMDYYAPGSLSGNEIIFGETLTSDIEIALGFFDSDLFWDSANLSDSLEISETDTDTLASVDSEAEGGTCSRVESVSLLQGSGDMAMMLAPILFLVGYTGWRRIK